MNNTERLFNRIAGVYGLFFNSQVRNYRQALKAAKADFDFTKYHSILDIGCGTGALSAVLVEQGLEVTGIEQAETMLAIAQTKVGGTVQLTRGNTLEGLPFPDKSFDLAIASYLAHGLTPDERQTLYKEMRRVAKFAVILIDYNEKRSLITDIAEYLEGGDYFDFIKVINQELQDTYGNLKIMSTSKRQSIYLSFIE